MIKKLTGHIRSWILMTQEFISNKTAEEICKVVGIANNSAQDFEAAPKLVKKLADNSGIVFNLLATLYTSTGIGSICKCILCSRVFVDGGPPQSGVDSVRPYGKTCTVISKADLSIKEPNGNKAKKKIMDMKDLKTRAYSPSDLRMYLDILAHDGNKGLSDVVRSAESRASQALEVATGWTNPPVTL